MARGDYASVGDKWGTVPRLPAVPAPSVPVPELRQIFEEWLGQIEGEILQAVSESGQSDVGSLAQRFKLSAESVQFIPFRLARQGKIDLSAGTARATENQASSTTAARSTGSLHQRDETRR
jgi:hypothetical protein